MKVLLSNWYPIPWSTQKQQDHLWLPWTAFLQYLQRQILNLDCRELPRPREGYELRIYSPNWGLDSMIFIKIILNFLWICFQFTCSPGLLLLKILLPFVLHLGVPRICNLLIVVDKYFTLITISEVLTECSPNYVEWG